ncbi:MAG: RNA 2',3'-cyclic phosphodiesterase [Flavobacteriales bacterium]|nr:RNA 2',3'-cyclic phosphodiesterase [Flavobacteriales bacterium]
MSDADPLRLFVGTSLPEPVIAGIRRCAAPLLQAPGWRVMPELQWHLTALFLGNRPAGEVAGIRRLVRSVAAETPRFHVLNGRLVTMPEERPTMLWVRFDPNPVLTELHRRLADALGLAPDARTPYWPHITLARSSGVVPFHREESVCMERFAIDHLTVFSSELHPAGSVHTPLASYIFT